MNRRDFFDLVTITSKFDNPIEGKRFSFPARCDRPPVNEYQPGKLPLVLLNRKKEKTRSPRKEETGFKLAQVERPARRA